MAGEYGAAPGQFNYPSELVVSEAGEVFVVDIMNNRIQVFDLEGNYLRAFGHGGRSAGTFARPSGIAVDAEGNVFAAEGPGSRPTAGGGLTKYVKRQIAQ